MHNMLMPERAEIPPVVLSIAGSDPSAGAGIQADLLTCARLGVHACTAITALTIQDSVNVQRFSLVNPAECLQQARVILDDIPVRVIKIGMLGSAEMVRALAGLLDAYPQIPVVLDPILAAGGGTSLAGSGLLEAMRSELLPKVSIITPNGPEALALTGAEDVRAAAVLLNAQGAQWVLLSGGHGEGPKLENLVFQGGILRQTVIQERLPHQYHGSGCTLASAVAAGLAKGQAVMQAIEAALAFTHDALLHAYPLGSGQFFPNRFYHPESSS
ncbi:bifunctional hydroxymethylpyrimidine kinase/phosphomethylpyrimidine kinase [Acidithiobacillus thiooxidans]|jgi:hydroxymethylpyrimidine/phosphomethylpyrimidine kinase|nr:hydroxymethylpyrimidine/phosphomethylpyrimidine kinase [Acidithiobacillus thiooxidans]